jgi:tripartite-type tricarboxylate transporter receptor subunit TctC
MEAVMNLPRREFLHLIAGVAVSPALSPLAWALDYPTRPVHIIVGFGAGGTPDIIARLVGQLLSQHLGQPFVIENRPGAGTNIATQAVVRAAPDGYTLLNVATTNAINATLYESLNYDLIRDIAPVAGTILTPIVMVVSPSVPVKTVPEFIAYVTANPGKVNMASTGTGNLTHVAGELLKMLTGIEMVHVPYRGSPAAQVDLFSGRVQVMFDTLPAVRELIKSGKLRALAVGTATRTELLPDLPTIGEFVPGYEASAVAGIGAPKGTSAEIIDKLNREINAGLSDPVMKARSADIGGTVLLGSAAEYGKLMVNDVEKWGKVVRALNIKPD